MLCRSLSWAIFRPATSGTSEAATPASAKGGPSPKSGGGLELEEQQLPETIPEVLDSPKEEPRQAAPQRVEAHEAHAVLTMERLQEIQAELLADDIAIDFERMKHWSEGEAKAFF